MRRRGFTLIEVLTAVAIMSIGAAGVVLAIYRGIRLQEKYADIMVMNDLVTIDQSVSVYRKLYGRAPSGIDELVESRILLGDRADYRLIFREDGAAVPARHVFEKDVTLEDYAERNFKR